LKTFHATLSGLAAEKTSHTGLQLEATKPNLQKCVNDHNDSWFASVLSKSYCEHENFHHARITYT